MLCRNWSTREGLPQDHVRAILRTRDGFLWLATDAGLARFDGFDFKTYGLREGLGAVAVLSLLETGDGTLWAGTMGGGVTALRDGKVVRTYTRGDGLPAESVARMAEDDEGCLWVCDRGGYARLKDGRFEAVPGSPAGGRSWVKAIHRARDGTLWISFPGEGLWKWKAGTWERDAVPADSGFSPAAFCEDADGRLWAGDDRGRLWCREVVTGSWRMMEGGPAAGTFASSLAAGPDGTVWVALFREGLVGYRDGTWIRPESRGNPHAGLEENVFATPDGQLWLGSSTRGLFALTPSRLEVRLVDGEAGNGANFIGALLESAPDEFLIGTQGQGLFHQAGGVTGRLDPVAELGPAVFVNCMTRAQDGRTWIGSQRGLIRLSGREREPLPGGKPFPPDVWELCPDGADGMWAGTGTGGLFHFGPDGTRAVPYGNSLSPVKGMAVTDDGTVWVGTRGGGLFEGKDGAWKHHGKEEGLASEVIRVIQVGRDGTLWVGTAGGGLALKRGDRFLAVSTRDGLPDDTVSQITEDEGGRLWLGTNRGLAVLSADEVAALKAGRTGNLHPRVIDRFDGLLSEEFTIVPPVRMEDGRLAFATTQGFALLRPEEYRADETQPPVFLEEVLVDGRTMEVKDGGIEVPPGAKRVEFRFTGVHFAAPERLRFRNRLGGLEDDWGSAGNLRTAVYRNVSPGDYRFEVSASTGNGLWSPQPASVRLVFRPRFWQTAWFRSAGVLLVLGGVAYAVRRRERQHAARRIHRLERQRAVDQERARIARDLHDDVGASLTQVALLSQLARNNLTRKPERAGQQVQEIFNTAKQVTRSLDEIVWAVNPVHDTIESFALFLGAFVQNYSHAAGLRCRVDVPENLPAAPLEASIRHHLYLATKEAIHNVAKHAGASEIRLTIALESGEMLVSIKDDGRGFDSGTVVGPHADGLRNLQSRFAQLGGTCTRLSVPGKGTTVAMRAPLELS